MPEQDNFVGTDGISSWDADRLKAYASEYKTVLNRYFGRRGAAPDVSDDLTQNVFLRLARRANNGAIDNAEAYLMQTASSVWMDYLRKKNTRAGATHLEFNDLIHSPEGLSPERVLMGKEALACVVRALQGLPIRTRNIYLLCRLDGEKRKDIAARYKISVSAIDKHLMIASKKIGLAVQEE